ncbi:SynChlorMet cassette protein ScmC [candidate division WOR-3 bacterium]|nr:SynChlorMet cassette protein ScmC [candidate division WOR-3 bacterium]
MRLELADGSRWTIVGADEPSALVVSELGKTMRLTPGAVGRELYAVVSRDRHHDPQKPSRNGAAVCWLSPLLDRGLQIIQMEKIAKLVALGSLSRGGLLLHGALAECKGAGYVLAGPSGVGKSTASDRLPLPHRSLCDDRTLVVRDSTGQYWAHPWPTWSQLQEGRDSSWPVENAVPLRGMFFLGQSPSLRLQPTGRTQTTALIMESAFDLILAVVRLSEVGDHAELWKNHLGAAKALAAAVPAYSLEMSLQGRFWKEIEKVLPQVGDTETRLLPSDNKEAVVDSLRADARDSVPSRPVGNDVRLRAVCLGSAMNPTLAESDVLEVEPYGQGRARPGDVICFKSPENTETCVRRVVSVTGRVTGDGRPKDEIRTRGDDSPHSDPWLLGSEDVAGRAVAVRRGTRWRPVSGGLQGRATAALLHGSMPLRRFGRRLPRRLHDLVAKVGPVGWVLPQHLRPRLVEFNGRHWVKLELLLAGREIGRYDYYSQAWRVRQPFRMFLDLSKLPGRSLWSRASLTGARFKPARRHEEKGRLTALGRAFSAGRSGFVKREPRDLPGSAPRHSNTGRAAPTMVEAAVEFATNEPEKAT